MILYDGVGLGVNIYFGYGFYIIVCGEVNMVNFHSVWKVSGSAGWGVGRCVVSVFYIGVGVELYTCDAYEVGEGVEL